MKKLLSLVVALVFVLCGMATVSAWEEQNKTPAEAYATVSQNPNAYILDVRTPCEWNWVGHPGVDGCWEPGQFYLDDKVKHIPFSLWGVDPSTKAYSMEENKFFDEEVVRQFDPGDTIILMCRSGKRAENGCNELQPSEELEPPDRHPAFKRLEELGYYDLYNMTGGFEGGKDTCGYRTVDGWKNSDLPYKFGTEGIWTPPQRGRSLK